MALKTVTGKVQNPDGSVPANAEVTFTLSQAAYMPGTQEVPPTVVRPTISPVDGSYSVQLQANNDLTPNGTYYTYTLRIGNALPVILTLVVPQTAGPFVLTNILSNPPTLSASPSHVSTLTVDGTATFTAGPVVIGTDPGGTQGLRVGPASVFSGLVTLNGGLVVAGGGVSFSGSISVNTGITVNSGGIVVSAGGLTTTGLTNTGTLIQTGQITLYGNIIEQNSGQGLDSTGALGLGAVLATAITLGRTGVQVTVPGAISLAGATLGFYGTAPVGKQTVTGSRGGNAALASLLTALAATGLLTDSSTV